MGVCPELYLGALQYKCKDIEQLYNTCSLKNWDQNKSRNGFIYSDHTQSHILPILKLIANKKSKFLIPKTKNYSTAIQSRQFNEAKI